MGKESREWRPGGTCEGETKMAETTHDRMRREMLTPAPGVPETDGAHSWTAEIAELRTALAAEQERSRGLEEALVEAVIPLEVIAGQDRAKPYEELSRELLTQVERSIYAVREALSTAPEPVEDATEAKTVAEHLRPDTSTLPGHRG